METDEVIRKTLALAQLQLSNYKVISSQKSRLTSVRDSDKSLNTSGQSSNKKQSAK